MRPVVLLLAAWRIWRLANMPRLQSFNKQFGEIDMSNGKFTPGPWFMTGNLTKYVEARIGDGLIQEVAAVGPTDADGGYGAQQLANARLIAAAPCMYSLLAIMAENGDNAARQLIERIGNEKM
jgi:hypothetical protein